ncbi:hypothetical protein ACFSX9_11835 [Flavobacterium ardleyense]|uniref:Lipoprotein n=1 Tax=Flavobacterium ardleyense TaxID=2038737 RepID=A0ABW5Z989_9FLAO
MKKSIFLLLLIALVVTTAACRDKTNHVDVPIIQEAIEIEEIPEGTTEETLEEPETIPKVSTINTTGFIPEGYVFHEEIFGDLNNDGLEDWVLIIKGTDKNRFVVDDTRGKLDRNRRGIIILFKNENGYDIVVKNYDCFSSENEEGGVYYAPELYFNIEKGKLFIGYAHGRYGYWKYNFRLKNNDFELIGYEASSNTGPLVNNETSINFLNKRKRVRINRNHVQDEEDDFEETWSDIQQEQPLRLSKIIDFEELEVDN